MYAVRVLICTGIIGNNWGQSSINCAIRRIQVPIIRLVTDLARQLDGSATVSNEQGTQVQIDFSQVD